MSLVPGARLGPYEVLSPIGAGGMGEVYRARDTRLQRDVAIKVLPEHLASDRERLARFEREAHLLASLNHPNIAHIYGFEASGDVRALVLELVDGETLAERIARGRIPLDEALPIAQQLARALETAHDQGIIHRDLKPANIMITPAGVVKVLDFGLARLSESAASGASSSMSVSPTITSPAMTLAGMILGTAAYMSPEQARGKAADRRADVWAFGCVLFEMLSGRRLFDVGDSISDVVAAILKNDPDWSLLPADVPAAVHTILRRCLQKDPQKRLSHLGSVRIELEELAHPVEVVPARRRFALQRAMPVAAAAVIAGALGGAAVWTMRPSQHDVRVLRFSIPVPPGDPAVRRLAVSRDGTRVAFVTDNRLYVQSLSEAGAKPVSGAEVSQGYIGAPVFSPDGESLAYWTGTEGNGILKRIPISGGAPLTMYEGSFPLGVEWNEDGLMFGQVGRQVGRAGPSQIFRLRSDGGAQEAIVTGARGELLSSPQLLPGGDAVLFTLAKTSTLQDLTQETWDRARIVVQQLRSGKRTTVIEGGSDARYLPTGHLVYAVGSTVFAVPFDVKHLVKTGSPVSVLTNVARTLFGPRHLGGLHLDVTGDGTVVYLADKSPSGSARLALVDPHSGQAAALKVPSGAYEFPRVSPDGKRVVVAIASGERKVNIWVYDMGGSTEIRQLTFDGNNRNPVWSHDSTRVTFQSDREGDLGIFWQRADGTGSAERLTRPEKGTAHVPGSWSPDGKTLLFSVEPLDGTPRALWMLRDGKVQPFGAVITNSVLAIAPAFSPDGRWVAYAATPSPKEAVLDTWVQPFPPNGTTKYLVGEGIQPLWSRSGNELFVQSFTQVVVRDVSTKPSFALGSPNPVSNVSLRVIGINVERDYDILPDGRFLGVVGDEALTGGGQSQVAAPPMQVVVNWFEELRRRVPAK